MNKDLKLRIFDIPYDVLNKINHAVVGLNGVHMHGLQRAKKLLADKKVKYGQLKRIIHDLQNIDKGLDLVKYDLAGGDLMLMWGKKFLDGERDIISNRKEGRKNADEIGGITGERKNSYLKKHRKKPDWLPPLNMIKPNSFKSTASALSSMKLFEEIEKFKKLITNMDTSYNTGQSKLSPLEVLGNQYRPIGLGVNQYTENKGYSSEEKLNEPEDKIAVTPLDINIRNQEIAANEFSSSKPYGLNEKLSQNEKDIQVTPIDIQTRIDGLKINKYALHRGYNSEEKLNEAEDKIAVTPQDINIRNQQIAMNEFNLKNSYNSGERASQPDDKIQVTPEDIKIRKQEIAINTYNSSKKYPDFK